MPTPILSNPVLDEAAASSAPVVFVYADDLHAFTFPEVGERLGVSLATVERLVARGDLRELRVGRSVRVTAAELRRFLSVGAA